MTMPIIYTPAALVEAMAPAMQYATELEDQASRASVTDATSAGSATDFIKVCNASLKKAEERRKEQVGPLNDHVKWINGEWATVTSKIERAKTYVQAMATRYVKAEQKRLQDIQDAERRKFEEEVIAAAAAAEKAGQADVAEKIVEAAISTPSQPAVRLTSRGSFTGASSSLRDFWKGSVAETDIKTVCLAIAEGHLPAAILLFSQAELNRIAGEVKVAGKYHGITIVNDSKVV